MNYNKLFNFKDFILNENLILENRIDDLELKYKDKIDKVTIDWLINNDPTENKAYIEWSLKKYATLNSIEKEKLKELKTPIYKTFTKIITKFHKNIPKMSSSERDINSYNNISQLIAKVTEDIDYSNSEIKSYGDVDIYVNNDEWLIFTPKTFEVAEKFGHNQRGGKNWCVCYDKDYFNIYFCPDGGITMIINKLDYTKNIALQKDNSGDVTVWNFMDESVLHFVYVTQQNNFINWLRKENDYDFIIDYFKNNPLKSSDMPDISIQDIKDHWIGSNGDLWYNFIGDYDIGEYLYYDEFRDYVYNNMKNEEFYYQTNVTANYMIDYLKNNDFLTDDIEINNLKNNNEFVKYIDDNVGWDLFFETWFNDNVTNEYIKNMIHKYDYDDISEYIRIEKLMNDAVDDVSEQELFNLYYQNK